MENKTIRDQFYIGVIFRDAWTIFKGSWLQMYGVYAVPFVLFVLYFIYSLSLANRDIVPRGIPLLYTIAQWVISLMVIKATLMIARRKTLDLKEILSAVLCLHKYLAAMIMVTVVVIVGFIFLIVPGIYLAFKYTFVPYLIVDKNLGPIEAMKASSKMTDGIKWDILGFYVAGAALAYLGLIALGVGILVSAPVAYLAYLLFYDKVLKATKIA
jgi:uncharacterized membrane protein